MKYLSPIKSNLKYLLVLFLTLMISNTVLADPGDGLCDGEDGGPDNCPLDTWVIVLVVVACLFGMYQLHKKQIHSGS
jgi:hypothetical protein